MPIASQGDPMSDLLVKVILGELGTNIETYQWYAGLANLIQAIILVLVLTQVCRYLGFAKQIDHIAIRAGIVAMSLAAFGIFIMSCVQFHKMIFDLPFSFISTSRTDTMCLLCYMLVSHLFTTPATIFYSVRVWRFSGRKTWVIVPLVVMIAGSWAILLYGAVKGFGLPNLTIQNAPQMKIYAREMENILKIYAGYLFAADCVITISSIFLLIKTKNEVLPASAHSGIFARIVALLVEAMVPPTACNCLLVIYSATSGSTSTLRGFNRLTTTASPLLHFLSLMLSLVARQTVRKLLDADPISQLRNASLPTSQGPATSWHSHTHSKPHGGFIEMPSRRSMSGASANDHAEVGRTQKTGRDWEKHLESSSDSLVRA